MCQNWLLNGFIAWLAFIEAIVNVIVCYAIQIIYVQVQHSVNTFM